MLSIVDTKHSESRFYVYVTSVAYTHCELKFHPVQMGPSRSLESHTGMIAFLWHGWDIISSIVFGSGLGSESGFGFSQRIKTTRWLIPRNQPWREIRPAIVFASSSPRSELSRRRPNLAELLSLLSRWRP